MRIWITIVSVAVLGMLAGCGGQTDRREEAQAPLATMQAAAETTAAEETPSENTTATEEPTPDATSTETATASVEPPPEETPAALQGEAAKEASFAPQEEVAEAPPGPEQGVSCEGFGSDLRAQQFFDNATPSQRATLDPEGDGFACSVGNPAAASSAAPKEPLAKEESSYRPPSPEEVRARLEEDRRAIETIGDRGEEEATASVSMLDEEDVENPQERRVRQSECWGLYQVALPSHERRQKVERILSEADAQGVTPGDVVGC